jgi:palmitoyltransferase ZDHHC9/14/18
LTKDAGEVASVRVECGDGEQILRWLAFVACERLEYIAGTVPGGFVPQAVLNHEGTVLDVDSVVNELFADGDSATVRFGPGPEAFTTRWEGRPSTPPFRWGANGEVAPSSELAWLEELDLEAFGAGRLVNESLASASSTAAAEDLAGALNALKTHAGCLQALFTLYAVPDDPDARSDGDKMTLEQFRAFALDVKAVASGPQTLAAQHVDECFGEAAKHQGGGKGAGAKKASDSSIQLDAFLVAVLRVAARKYDIATAKQQGFAELSARLERFVDAHVYPNCAPRLETIHAELGGGVTDDSTLLMKKARRLTTQTLTSCLLRRPATKGERELDAKSLATHAKKWGLLAASSEAETDARRETITRAAYARVIVHAKQNVADARAFRPRGWPFRLDANEFERALLSLAWLLYERRVARMDAEAAEAAAALAAAPAEGEEAGEGERAEDSSSDSDEAAASDGAGATRPEASRPEAPEERQPFVAYLGEFLDDVFVKAGVLHEDEDALHAEEE